MCSKKCSSKCNATPCELDCKKVKSCGHPCPGFCGEPCPDICPGCDLSLIRDKYVMLDCCHSMGHSKIKEQLTDINLYLPHCNVCLKPINLSRCKDQILQRKDLVVKAHDSYFRAKIGVQKMRMELAESLDDIEAEDVIKQLNDKSKILTYEDLTVIKLKILALKSNDERLIRSLYLIEKIGTDYYNQLKLFLHCELDIYSVSKGSWKCWQSHKDVVFTSNCPLC